MVEGDAGEPDARRDFVADRIARLHPILAGDDRRPPTRRLVDVDAIEGEAERGDGRRRRPLPAGAKEGIEAPEQRPAFGGRSEEHTSELQSLMRIPYAVFCLKK